MCDHTVLRTTIRRDSMDSNSDGRIVVACHKRCCYCTGLYNKALWRLLKSPSYSYAHVAFHKIRWRHCFNLKELHVSTLWLQIATARSAGNFPLHFPAPSVCDRAITSFKCERAHIQTSCIFLSTLV